MSSLTCKGTLRLVFICPAQNSNPSSPRTHCIREYSIRIHIGKGGERRVEPERRGEYRSQSWVENTNMTDCTQEIGYLRL
jgi:hypothetical protein